EYSLRRPSCKVEITKRVLPTIPVEGIEEQSKSKTFWGYLQMCVVCLRCNEFLEVSSSDSLDRGYGRLIVI
uniref:Uncharacterized protein n=1 Tax=Anopheles dirus TaxID=7168 RepID=A0A182NYG5_9DIPT